MGVNCGTTSKTKFVLNNPIKYEYSKIDIPEVDDVNIHKLY